MRSAQNGEFFIDYPGLNVAYLPINPAGISVSSAHVIAIGRSPSCDTYRISPRKQNAASGSVRTSR